MEANATLPALDGEGYLIEPKDWDEEVARFLAAREHIELEADHWEVIRFMRAYFDEHQIAPDARHTMKHLGADGRKRLFELFPYGYVAQACKVAGMRRPRAWSTG